MKVKTPVQKAFETCIRIVHRAACSQEQRDFAVYVATKMRKAAKRKAPKPEMWGIFFKAGYDIYRSENLPGVYASEAEAQVAIDKMGDEPHVGRFAKRI